MQKDMAYFLGILIAGGSLTNNKISIEFPYKRWSQDDYRISPSWFNDSVTKITPLINRILNTGATPRYVEGNTPRFYIEISPIPTILYDTLTNYRIKPLGELRRHASLDLIAKDIDTECKKNLVSGIADVIGSCRASHRNRSTQSTTISFEILGENWKLVYDLCQVLHELNVPVDQILWNHPNMHAGSTPDAYWKKGHKLRIKAGDFRTIGYGFECKNLGLDYLLKLETENRGYISKGVLCPKKTHRINGIKVIHRDEKSSELPEMVRGHFIHYTHICQALGCPHAPSKWLEEQKQKYMPNDLVQSNHN